MIEDNTRADLFRCRVEDKNTISKPGAIYVGTGKSTTIDDTKMTVVNADGSTGTATGAYYGSTGVAPTAVGQVPVSISGTNSTGVVGLEFKSVNDALKDEKGDIKLDAAGIAFTVNGSASVESDYIYVHGSNTDIAGDGSLTLRSETVTITNVSLGTNLQGPTTGSLYIAPSGTPSLSSAGATGSYSSDTKEENLAPIIYNIGKRLDSLGFKSLGNDVSFDFVLKYRPTGSTQFEIGTLTITPFQVEGNYCRATIDFKPKDVYRRNYPDVTYATATDDIDKVFLFYFSDYSTGYIRSQFTTTNMSSVNNVSVFPVEDIYFEYAIPVELSYNITKVGQTMMNLFFHLRPNSNGVGVDAEMFIRYQNYRNLTAGYQASLESDWEGREEPIKIPTITYKRRV